jgi:hypothetical protein
MRRDGEEEKKKNSKGETMGRQAEEIEEARVKRPHTYNIHTHT